VPPREKKMLPTKAHDCDVMLTMMLVVGIPEHFARRIPMAIMSLYFFFNAISQNVIDGQ